MPYLHVLSDTDRIVWIKEINSIRMEYENMSNIESITVLLPGSIRRTELHPMNIVSLACLLEFLNSKCKSLKVLVQNNDTLNFLCSDLKLEAYFAGLPHTEAASSNLFNLWKIIPEQAPSYSHGLSSYFKQNLFKDLDISFFNIAIDELYGNVADHSNANGVAYSYIEYDQISKALKVSFCDFGIGIPTSIKSASIPNPDNLDYIALATRKGITTK